MNEIDSFLAATPELIEWYRATHRKLPWRRAQPDPYEVYISEVMSQQSTMPTVLRYFARWMEKFPNFQSFSNATQEEVIALWAGLGYYSRARNVHATKELLKTFHAEHQRWPQNQKEWMTFPGVGPYTAGAIASMVFQDKVLPIDGNVQRVLARYWKIANPLNNPLDQKALAQRWLKIAELLPDGQHGAVTQAMMELGALVCKPRAQALCLVCPLQSHCQARLAELASAIPAPKIRKKMNKISQLGIFYHSPKDRHAILIRQIPPHQRLQGQWEVPLWELSKEENENTLLAHLSENFEVRGPVRHSITVHQYQVYRVNAGAWKGPLPKGHRYFNLSETEKTPVLTTLTQKLLLI